VLILFLLVVVVGFLEFEKFFDLFINFFSTVWGEYSYKLLVGGLVLGALLLVFLVFRNFLRKFSLYDRASAFFKKMIQSIIGSTKMPNKGLFVFLSLLIWFFYVVSCYACLYILPSETGFSFYLAFILTVLGSIGMSFPVPGGIGSFHAFVGLGLLAFGFSKATGEKQALVMHAAQMIGNFGIGLLDYFYFLFLKKQPTSQPLTKK